MTRHQQQWLDDPVAGLRVLPAGPLIVARSSSDVTNPAEIADRAAEDTVVKYRRFPDCRILRVEEMVARGVKFAVLG